MSMFVVWGKKGLSFGYRRKRKYIFLNHETWKEITDLEFVYRITHNTAFDSFWC